MKAATPPRGRRANGEHPPPAPVPTKPSSLLEAIILAASDPSIDTAKIEHLVRLHRDMEAAEAERLFNEAMSRAQARMQPVVADAVNDQTNSKYASYAALDRVVRPIYTAEGFALTFTAGERSTDTAVEIVAYLTGHGHGRRYTVTMPADGLGPKGSPVMSRTHAASSAITYGMRRLLTMIWNLAIDKDDDGNAAGKVSTPKSSAPLKRENVWAQFADEMRAAKSLPALQAVVARWKPRVTNWSGKWRNAAEDMYEQCHARLSGARQEPMDDAATDLSPGDLAP
jgi:hypothetical protein